MANQPGRETSTTKYVPIVLRQWESHASWAARKEQREDTSDVDADQSDASSSSNQSSVEDPAPATAGDPPRIASRKFTIRRTGLYFRFYDVHDKATLPRPQTGSIGDVALWKRCHYVLEMDQHHKPGWTKVKDGHAYPDQKLPEHELAIRPGVAPAWVKGSSKAKSMQRSMRKEA